MLALLFVALLPLSLSFQPQLGVSRFVKSAGSRLIIQNMPQFGKSTELYKIKKESEGDDYFESEVGFCFCKLIELIFKSLSIVKQFDRTPVKDRLPVALGFLAFISIPFLVGLVLLYSSK